MSFFEELKRRNVIRVAIAYGVAAWLLLQLTDVMIDLLGLPDTAGKYVILLLVIGFPLALFFAWAFEMTPEGIMRESDVDRTESITHLTGRKLDRTIIAALTLAVIFFIYDKFSAPEPVTQTVEQEGARVSDTSGTAATSAEPSIAVLPFVNMSNEADQEYFSDGISEELLNLLVRVEGLKVASRTSSFTYKGENQNIPEIAKELKVDHILEGSVRKAGNRVRITAQLIDVASDRHLWSDTFDRELVDIFAIQDEIANSIVNALKNELGIGLQSVTVEVATENLDAYDLYLKARGLFIARQDLDVANKLFEQATQLDPGFALAWEGLAASQSVSGSWLLGDGIDHATLSIEAAQKALELDPDLSMPYAVLGSSDITSANTLESVEYYDIAIANDPKNATAWLWRGLKMRQMGFQQEAISNFEQCLDIDPHYQNCRQHMAVAYLYSGDPDTAVSLYLEAVEQNFHSTDDEFVSHFLKSGQPLVAYLAAGSSVFGQYAPIKEWIEAIENPEQNHSGRIARWKRWAEKRNMDMCSQGAVIVAFKLDHCYGASASWGYPVIWHPDAAYFRKTATFKDLANRKFLGYWQKHGFPPQCRPLEDGDFECD